MKNTEYDEVKANLIRKSLEKDSGEIYIPVERRKGKDSIIKFINVMCFVLWVVLFMIFAIIEKAGKNIANIQRENLLWASAESWNVSSLNIALIGTVLCIIVCTICIILNFTRHRRRTDRIKKSLIIAEITSFLIGIFLILKLFN